MSESRRRIPIIAVLALLLVATAVRAETPRNMFVMAKALDDLITLDPAEVFEFSGAEVTANLYQRLFRPNSDDPSRPIPEVAESWRTEDEGRTFVITVRDGLRFASGLPVTQADVVFSLRRAVALNKAPSFILTQFGLTADTVADAIRPVGEKEVALRLDRAYAPTLVLNALSAGIASVVDRRTVMDNALPADAWGHTWLRTRAAGSGPLTLRRWAPGEYLLLDPNSHFDPHTMRLDRVILRDIREPSTQRLMLVRGDIDMARNLGPDQIAALRSEPGIRILTARRARLFYLGLNQRHPALSKPEVQRAMRFLIDYDGIANGLLAGRASVHQSFLPDGFLGALTDRPFAFDPSRAREILAEAGLHDGFDVTMDVRSDPMGLLIAQAIQAGMAEGGISLEIVPGSGKQVLTKYRARRHDIFIGQWGPDYLDPHTNAGTFARNPDNGDRAAERTLAWRNGWDIPDLTRHAEQAVLIADADRRAAIYADLQTAVRDASPFIVMFQENELIAMRDVVTGFVAGLTSDQTMYHRIEKR